MLMAELGFVSERIAMIVKLISSIHYQSNQADEHAYELPDAIKRAGPLTIDERPAFWRSPL